MQKQFIHTFTYEIYFNSHHSACLYPHRHSGHNGIDRYFYRGTDIRTITEVFQKLPAFIDNVISCDKTSRLICIRHYLFCLDIVKTLRGLCKPKLSSKRTGLVAIRGDSLVPHPTGLINFKAEHRQLFALVVKNVRCCRLLWPTTTTSATREKRFDSFFHFNRNFAFDGRQKSFIRNNSRSSGRPANQAQMYCRLDACQ